MRSFAYAAHGAVIVSILAGSVAIAHENDPKGTVKRIPYDGPAWRKDVDGANGGLAGGWDSFGVELLSHLPMSTPGMNGGDGNDSWGYTSPSGREYAIMGTTNGTAFIEVTNPGNAQVIDYVDGPGSLWRDIKTFGAYAYAVSEGGSGIQVIDMSNIDNGSVTLANTVTTGGTSATHNVAIDPVRGLLCRCGGGSNGLRIYDLALNPTNPPYVGSWGDKYVHDAQIHTMTTGPYAGRVIAFCCGGLNGGGTATGLDILDITTPSNIIELGATQYPNGAYCHQGWLTQGESHFCINDELFSGLSTTHVIDVSDLTNPSFSTSFTNGNSAICHNLYIKGNLLYAANYRSGLRIYDCSNPNNLSEVAYFDTYPANNSASFNGAWSVYPYFESGTIIVSDIESGLFVLSAGDVSSVSFNVVTLPDPISSAGDTVTISMEASGTTLDNSSAVALFNDGTGTQQISMNNEGGNLFSGTLPSLECPGTLSISFSVVDTEGELYESSTSSVGIADGEETVFYDNGQSDLGYAVSGSATDGQWDRGVPVACNRGDPGSDGDGSGSCWLTDNSSASSCNSDVDGGATTLTSPALDASSGEAYLSYLCWYDNTGSGTGADPGNDIFVVEISGNNGSSWTTLETVGPSDARSSGGWTEVSVRVSDYVTPSDSVRVRFTAEDAGDGSVIEAAIDGLAIDVVSCDDDPPGIPGDVNGDGAVDGQDLSIVLGYWGPCEDPLDCPADLNDDGVVNGPDLSTVLGYWSE